MNYNKLKSNINKIGFDVKRYPTYLLKNRMRLIEGNNIETILDVGANVGQYAKEMRRLGFKGKIISFEPIANVFKVLEKEQSIDPDWSIHNMALGHKNEETQINISNASASSSLLEMLPSHFEAAPTTKYVETESITVRTLDSVFPEICKPNESIYLKIDVQGFEKNVIDGAKESLKKIKGIQMELSIVQLYSNELTYIEMIQYLEEKGFYLHSLEPGFANVKTGQLLQADGIFFRK